MQRAAATFALRAALRVGTSPAFGPLQRSRGAAREVGLCQLRLPLAGQRCLASSAVGNEVAGESAQGESLATSAKSSSSRLLYPPGQGAPATKAEKFGGLVAQALQDGDTVKLAPVGAAALWHSLRALAVGNTAADFEVSWGAPGKWTDNQRPLHLLAQKGAAWEDFDYDISSGCFVSKSTSAEQLAKKICLEIRKKQSATLHTYADAEVAVAVMLKAIAIASDLGSVKIMCSAGSLKRESEEVARVLVHARQVSDTSPLGDVFIAYPPGVKADKKAVGRFEETVRQRMGQGMPVQMECRGRDASVRGMMALASVKTRVAEFEVRWVDGFIGDAAAGEQESKQESPRREPAMRALEVHAVQSETWTDFNSTDFNRTKLLKAGDGTPVKGLARAIGAEVKSLGAVAVHAYAESSGAVFAALKAVASVPVEHQGLQVACVPSFGWASDGAGGKSRSLRLFVRRATQRVPRSSKAPQHAAADSAAADSAR